MSPRMFFLAGLLFAAGAIAQQATQKSALGGVTVAVTPVAFAPAQKVWSFRVVYDTHTQELSDDVVAGAVLADDKGRAVKPLAWEGPGPGGHHRSGVLKFPALEPFPQSIELRLARPGEAAPRVFRFPLK